MPARRQSDVNGTGEGPSEPAKRRSKDGKEKETFGCTFPGCGQTYSRMEYLKRHQRKHQDDRPFQCKDCTKAFARSDVLLRHRRRCHPTPPPADRSSRSPIPPHRAYPGVPVSSSRHDDFELSEDLPDRKRARDSTGDNVDRAGRPRLEEDEEEDDANNHFGESNRFRQNGMGNGGVYGVNSFYPNEGDPSYTPHLLPIFQNTNVFQQPNGEEHLEDASVLLSMAYPTGMPENENNDASKENNGQDATVSDWETGQQTINMMMEQARVDTTGATQNGTSGDVSADTSHDPSPVLTEPINYLGSMSWLDNQVPKEEGSSGLQGWLNQSNPSPQPLSPFPFSSFISPSAFGLSLPADESNQSDDPNAGDGAVKSLLDMLQMYDIPQTRANPNPERPLLRIHHDNMSDLTGGEVSRHSRFYIPADRFAGCYHIPHWALPPLKTLSLMAHRTCETVLQHFSFVHMPTFRLIDTAACLAFAICTVGGVRSTSSSKSSPMDQRLLMQQLLDGPAPPGSTWEDMYRNNYGDDFSSPQDPIKASVGRWHNGQIVRNEKSNMLVKSFSLAKGVLMTEYNVALLQALILYNAPYFLSEDETERHMANMFLGTIVNITRQIGFFNQELEHFDTEYQLPQDPHTPNELDLHWRRWIQLETRRRTAYLVLHLDTISALESSIQCIIAPSEISHMPLPAPDTIWKAETAEDWLKAIKHYRPMTLDEAMRRIFFLPTYGAFDTMHEKADTKFYHLLNESELGPFARVAMILTLLRGIIDIGEGKRDRGDWRDLTDLWMGCSWLKPAQKMLASDGQDLGRITRDSLRERFSLGLQRWRQGWDFDPTCMSPGQTGSTGVSPLSGNNRTSSSPPLASKLNYCEEALPFYWLAQALLNLLNAAPPNEPGWNGFSGIKYSEMLKSSRTFTRMGEGVANTTGASGSASASGSTGGTGNTPGSIDPMAMFNGDLTGLEGLVF